MAIKLLKYGLTYQAKQAIKAQVLANFEVELT